VKRFSDFPGVCYPRIWVALREEEQRARILGISGVPFYVINEAVSISGAQPAETFLEAIRTTSAKKSTKP
jgi:predicted DsbA family dithiol-disulfide isomerase